MRRIRDALRAAFEKAGYDVRRRRPPVWGEAAFHDQEQLLAAAPVRTILDVGAHFGESAQTYRALFPHAVIHAFEPAPQSYQHLAQQFADDERVSAHPVAVADRPGQQRLYVNAVEVTNSLLPLIPSAAAIARASSEHLDATIDVEVVTLDAFCDLHQIAAVDLLKMDIQGAELLALQGAADLLRKRAVRLIYLEVTFQPLYRNQAFFTDIHSHLASHGYALFGLYNLMYSEHGLGWADATS
jgi:FkbM family methyltransferase